MLKWFRESKYIIINRIKYNDCHKLAGEISRLGLSNDEDIQRCLNVAKDSLYEAAAHFKDNSEKHKNTLHCKSKITKKN